MFPTRRSSSSSSSRVKRHPVTDNNVMQRTLPALCLVMAPGVRLLEQGFVMAG
jgi:hypothetical protein